MFLVPNFVIMVPKHVFEINFFENKFEIKKRFFSKLKATSVSNLVLCRNKSFRTSWIQSYPPDPKYQCVLHKAPLNNDHLSTTAIF